jgi:hypothetical protein
MPRLLGPSEYEQLRNQYKVGPSNFGQYFERGKGGIYLKDQTEPQPQSYVDFINQAFKNPEYTQAKEQLSQSQEQLDTLTSQEPRYALKKQLELQQQDPELQRLTQEKGKFASQLYSQPFTDQYKDIFDPVKRNQLIAQAVGNTLGQLNTTNQMIGNRQGTAKEQAQLALEQLQAQIGGAKANVEANASFVKDLTSTLKDIAEKGYSAKVKEQERTQAIEDALTKYTDKLAIDQKLRINDFKPNTSSSGSGADKTYTGEYVDNEGNKIRYVLNPSTGKIDTFNVGTPGADPTALQTKLATEYDSFATRLETDPKFTLKELESAKANKEIDPLTYNAILGNVNSGKIKTATPVKKKKGKYTGFLPIDLFR